MVKNLEKDAEVRVVIMQHTGKRHRLFFKNKIVA